MTISIGIIGAGGVADRHASVLTGLEGVAVTAVADRDPDAAGALAGRYGARALPDVDALLGTGPDAVYICVPPGAHGPIEHAVIDAGLPFFVEKPLATDLATAEKVAAAVLAKGLLTATGYHWRHLDTVRTVAALLADNPARLAIGAWLDKVPPPAWWTSRELSGGPMIEQATHVVDLLRVLVGEVTSVHAAGAGPGAEGDVDAATAATLRFASGAVGSVVATSVLRWKERAGVELFADGLAVRLTEDALTIRTADGERTTTPQVDGRVAVDRAFVDAVAGGPVSPALVGYGEALRTHRVACALTDAAAGGSIVAVRG